MIVKSASTASALTVIEFATYTPSIAELTEEK